MLSKRSQLLEIAQSLLEQPTAPFHEGAVRDQIVTWLRQCPNVRLKQDKFGNLIAHYRHRTRASATWAFAAHMDHPGWVATRGGVLRFLGSVPPEYLVNPRTRSFGTFAMWDLPAFELKNDQIHSRACDDLLGCAEIICLFRELEAIRAKVSCLGLFTRAEEVGFVGAIKLAQEKIVPRSTTIVSLETSAPRGTARMGSGPIVRVGDRMSIFDNEGTSHLLRVAESEEIPVQRCLLDGGTCEATAYQLYGYRCVAASLALGHYHNCGPDQTIVPEFVSVDDYANMVRLCLATVLSKTPKVKDRGMLLRKKLEKNADSYRSFYRRSG